MRLICAKCPTLSLRADPKSGSIVRSGFFYRKSDHQRIQRYRCVVCKRSSSSASLSPCFRQNKRQVNQSVFVLLSSGFSQRRMARVLKIHPITVARKLRFLGLKARTDHQEWLARSFNRTDQKLLHIQFDEMETSEHSKCKPLSIALAVDSKTRRILDIEVSVMPSKGHLAAISRKRYGPRPDHRRDSLDRLFETIKPILDPSVEILSDECPRYPGVVRSHCPMATHKTTKGGRGCIVGQGELKKLHFDPLFALNHTAAMLRANVNRLFRRTWCTTKKREALLDHLWIYVMYHIHTLIQAK